ncbi:MAG: DUF6036 family nucleotidyltransferase [Bryobacteraceae bacterium]
MLNRYRDVFASFHSNECRYVVLGGIAAILYGVQRTTFDVDILIEPTEANADKVIRALRDAGLGTAHLITAEELLAHEITIFKDRVRVDVQTSTPGLTFDDAWKNRHELSLGGPPFFVVSRDDLIRSKLAAGRPIDLSDVKQLRAKE